jgi:hypothetical protein
MQRTTLLLLQVSAATRSSIALFLQSRATILATARLVATSAQQKRIVLSRMVYSSTTQSVVPVARLNAGGEEVVANATDSVTLVNLQCSAHRGEAYPVSLDPAKDDALEVIKSSAATFPTTRRLSEAVVSLDVGFLHSLARKTKNGSEAKPTIVLWARRSRTAAISLQTSAIAHGEDKEQTVHIQNARPMK